MSSEERDEGREAKGEEKADPPPVPEAPPSPPPPSTRKPLAKNFRWQAFFQQCDEPLFVLDRRRRLLFVNRAWETLTGVPASEAHLLVCRRPRPAAVGDPPEVMLGHALTPPPEVLQGTTRQVRRLFPGREPDRRWWDVEFMPLRQAGEQGGFLILGRIRPCPVTPNQAGAAPMPERLVNLRQKRVEHFSLEAWSSPLPGMRRLVAQARLASQVHAPVLLLGEPGTGKQTLARTIHYLSPRRSGVFAALDCRLLPSTVVAGLLFGDRGGGREDIAAYYLREPACLPRDLQLRLCELIAQGIASTPGGLELPRIFAGCSTAPAEPVRTDRLLDDLACALSTLVIEVPPLRQRQADLPDLIERLLPRAGAEAESQVTGLSADAWAVVRGYSWPGNLRELFAVLRDACDQAGGRGEGTSLLLRAADLPSALRQAHQATEQPLRSAERLLPLEPLLEQVERRLIELALRRTRGHKARAARLLGITRPRLWRRMIALKITDAEADAGEENEEDEKET
jgi:energy-coupling factor transporter ATP-binding protein EcfA2